MEVNKFKPALPDKYNEMLDGTYPQPKLRDIQTPDEFLRNYYIKYPEAKPQPPQPDTEQSEQPPENPEREIVKPTPPVEPEPTSQNVKPRRAGHVRVCFNDFLSVLTVIGYVLLFLLICAFLLWGVVWCITFACVIFTHKHQIQVMSSYGGYVTGWVLVSIVGIILTIALLAKEKNDKEGSWVLFVVYGVFMLTFTLVYGIKLRFVSSDFYPPNYFNVTAVEKKLEENSYGSGKAYIYFDGENTGPVDITEVVGTMIFYDDDGTNESEWTMTFDVGFESGTTKRVYFTFDSKYSLVYNTELDDMRITFKITSMKFKDNDRTFEYHAGTKTIKEPIIRMPEQAIA